MGVLTNNNKDWHKFKDEHEDTELTESSVNEDEDNEQDEAALDHPSYAVLEEKLTLAEQKAHENWEKSVRVQAELENTRQRMERELNKAQKYAADPFIKAILPVIDSLEQALQIAQKNSDPALYEGLELTMKQFEDVLKKFDVECINPQDQVFNPQEHEAMSIQEVADKPANTVIAVFQKGYKLNDRVVRPARVIVSKTKES